MKVFMRSACIVMSLLMLLCLVACGGKGKYDTDKTGKGINVVVNKVRSEIDSMTVSDFTECDGKESDYVLIKVKGYGEIVVVLREDIAPITVKNFKTLVKSGFYSGTIFHRIIEGFMIQGGGYIIKDGKQIHKEVSSIKGEFTSNGVINNLKHVRGVISMARTDVPDSASSEFFIMHEDSDHLNGNYASFGYVLAGMDVVDAIATCAVNDSAPVEDVVIESITFVQPK